MRLCGMPTNWRTATAAVRATALCGRCRRGPPDGTPPEGGLCISFSAALLNDTDWDGDIVYHVDHVHQTDIDKQDARYVLAYDGSTASRQLQWNSSDLDAGTMPVPAGGYDRPVWFFTDRGTYEFQVHIQGSPDTTLEAPISEDDSVTSDVREYVIHVGAEADLSVGVEAVPDSDGDDNSDGNLDPGEDVTITITASNAGPETAPTTKVAVGLPEGLTYSSHVPATDGFTESKGIWTWDAGRLASDASKTLTITAEVGSNTHGQTLTAEATISATETVEITGDRGWCEDGGGIRRASGGPEYGQRQGYGLDHGSEQKERGSGVPGYVFRAGELTGGNRCLRADEGQGTRRQRRALVQPGRRR